MIQTQTTIVKSSTIDSLYYSSTTDELMVTFKNGTNYTYWDVTLEDYLTMITSESIGKALNQIIKPKYKYAKHEEL